MTEPLVSPVVTLRDGLELPQLGLGVYKVDNADIPGVISAALDIGYRLIDTAALYGNEESVGQALRESDVQREDIVVTTKIWNDDHGYDAARRAFDASMDRLGLDVLDLCLIHWAVPEQGLYVDTWRALIDLQEEGRVRSIGVSNFAEPELREIIDATGVTPSVHQIELHPFFNQARMREVNRELIIPTEAWAPLARGGELFTQADLHQIAAMHDATPAQVVLAWHRQIGTIAIPKSVSPERLRENFESLRIELTDAQMDLINELDRGIAGRTGMDPATMRRIGE
ncbi:aldo/keto reductase [Helcobacillus massiliensis]|uniref:aldo/keto reductase n=1 Tax=Helcobacillus massiliensis TaxID=521392 RepID=UPI0021A7CE59|nr:aldo/keto reductase [Helcobacillus massiliensis]MCT1556811.1 aldo/keto reductase [Helcobacillus massiliensis]MCT2035635.1 aldo/keto reductase [Helcobacillus massiliensis]MCT2330913.1 aldo/keto reductase [Helcobacillus massiliensis]